MSMEKCTGCCYLKGENEIGLGYCSHRDEIIFTDHRCRDWREIKMSYERWVSYDEGSDREAWKTGGIKALCVYAKKPVISGGIGKGYYVDNDRLKKTNGSECMESQENFTEKNPIGNDETLMGLFPAIGELSGTYDLYRVTIEKIKG